jgi:hypothetical protein
MGGPNFEGSVAVWMVAIASCILFSVHALTGDFDNLRSD